MADHFETSTVISCGTHLKIFLCVGGGGGLHTVTAHDRFLLNFFLMKIKFSLNGFNQVLFPKITKIYIIIINFHLYGNNDYFSSKGWRT